LRDYKLYLHDVKEAVEKIETFTKGYTFEEFAGDAKTVDAWSGIWNYWERLQNISLRE
jgi:uncharacterized protein with HEPN domain